MRSRGAENGSMLDCVTLLSVNVGQSAMYGHELKAVVGPDVAGRAAQHEEIGQNIDRVDRIEPAIDADCQALMAELVDDGEHAVLPAIMGAILDKVVRPAVVGMLWPQTDAGPVGEPKVSLMPNDRLQVGPLQ